MLWQASGPRQKAPGTYWPTIDPATGELWVASPWDSAYWVVSQDGTYLRSWGTPGAGPGQLNLLTHDPHPDGVGAIAFEPDGTFYVADNGNYRVQKFDPQGRYLLQWGTFGNGDGEFVSPKAIFVHGDLVDVEDDARNDLQEFDATGHYIRTLVDFGGPLTSIDGSGNLFAGSDDTSFFKEDPTGREIARWVVPAAVGAGASISKPLEDAKGNVYLWVAIVQDPGRPEPTDRFMLVEFDRSRTLVHEWGFDFDTETATLAPDGKAIYFAYIGPYGNWPYVRKYALP